MFLVLGLLAVRGSFWWALAVPVLIADLFPGGGIRDGPRRRTNWAIVAGLVLLGVAFLPWFRPAFSSTANSAAVTDGLLLHSPEAFSSRVPNVAGPGSRLFLPELWASWFEFELRRYPVFVDPRIEIFSTEVWDDYRDVSAGRPGWGRILDEWRIDVLVLSRAQQSGLIKVIREDATWRVVFEDGDGLLLVRSR
jgi:hypothetical protein